MNWDWDKLRENQNRYQQKKDGGDGKIPKPPQIDDFFNKFKGLKFSGIFIIVLILVVVFLGGSMVFTVDRNEVGVVQRFGKYVRTVGPGLNFKLPSGIEKVTMVDVETRESEEFGVSVPTTVRGTSAGGGNESALMLTGDLNVAVVPWIVLFRRSEPLNYLFKVKDPRILLRDMSEACMRTIVGDRSINEVITKREEIASAAQEMLQQEMDKAEAGVSIVTIEMKRTNVPGRVQPSFNEVNQAIQEKEQTIYKAKEEYNKAVPQAVGEAQRVIKDAEGYAIDRVNRAQGDAAKFTSVYSEYIKARDVTKRRIYLETMMEILPLMGQKYIIDSGQKNLLPFLNMGESRDGLTAKEILLKEGE